MLAATVIPLETKFEGDLIMKLKKLVILSAVIVPMLLVVSILVSLVFTSYFSVDAHIDWILVVSLTVLFSILVMWHNRRDLKRENKSG